MMQAIVAALRKTAYADPKFADLAAECVIALRGREPRFGTFSRTRV
jgi:hypothetical protein